MTDSTSTPAARGLLWLAGAVLLALMLSGIGSRLEWWHWGTGLTMLRYAFYFGLGVLALGLVALVVAIVKSRGRDILVLGHALALALIPVAFVAFQIITARSVPPIHDITTDPDDPPVLQAVAGVPEKSIKYPGIDVFQQQKAAYPDLVGIPVALSVAATYDNVRRTAESLGWEILVDAPNERHLQAVDTTFWFGFKDDISVRVRAKGDGSLVDIRSVSRVGVSDVGKNAARIRRFAKVLSEQ